MSSVLVRTVRMLLKSSLMLFVAAALGDAPSAPPIAKKVPHETVVHGEKRIDDYFWLRERENPDVIAYLEAENSYTDAMTKHTEALREKLYLEMKARIKQTDLSVPARMDDYYYYSRTVEGQQYRIICRKRGGLEADEEVLLDENVLAAGKGYFRVGAWKPSPNHALLAYATDTDGGERYTIYVKDLATGDLLPDSVEHTAGAIEWTADNRTLFYTTLDDARRPYKLFRHVLGSDAKDDSLIYHESDPAFNVWLSKTRSERFLVATSASNTTSEVRFLDASNPEGDFAIVVPREHEVEYSIDHRGEEFFILTNRDAKNFKIVRAPISSPGAAHWADFQPYREAVKIDDIELFANHLVVFERENGQRRIRVHSFTDGVDHVIECDESVYAVYPGENREFDAATLRFNYMSMVTPNSVYDYNLITRSRELMKRTEVLGGFDAADYHTERVFATAPDGVRIPILLLYRKEVTLDAQNPCLLYGYGSYGASMDPTFSSNRLSLVDRGVVYAIAQIRGGGELGRPWYENGKLLNKRNTFTDFIACAEHLIAQKITRPDRLAISGGSAGGLLMGAVVNLRPELFKVCVANVPFVDVINTMLDPSIPLTVIEYEEWGNPNEKKYYDYMLSYSPYDNVAKKAYPDMLITTGLNDPRVAYWEPAKWTAKLRTLKMDSNTLLLKTNLGAGHGGASGRYDRLREVAFEYAFILDKLGIAE